MNEAADKPAVLAEQTISSADHFAGEFRSAKPFRHVVIEDFFEQEFARDLLQQFPAFEKGNCRNENGTLGNKSTYEQLGELGPAFVALDKTIRRRPFLDAIGRMTGIPDLLFDPWYFGGGTHESRNGQDLDAHVDFNRHPVKHWHRRLNLIVYLNDEWEEAWGGSLQLHSDPRSPENRTSTVAPGFNRCVIFETTEHSWHGFPPIALPEDRLDLTRRSIALYFYTTERPADELAETHSTIYVDRPLPERFQPGYTLDAGDRMELEILMARRDQHNQRLYRDITALNTQLEQARRIATAGPVAVEAVNSARSGYGVLRRAAGKLRRMAGRALRD